MRHIQRLVFAFLLVAMGVFLSTKALAQGQVKTQTAALKLETFIDGKEKPLVCSQPVLAKDNLSVRPNLQVMWENFLYDRPPGVWRKIGGLVERNGNLPESSGGWNNACAVRMSHMLNEAGHIVPHDDALSVSGKDKSKRYFFRVNDMEVHFREHFGEPDLLIEDRAFDSFDLPNEPGLILLDMWAIDHATIWNGAGSVDGSDITGARLVFWRLPCFMPDDRDSQESPNIISASY